jgi:peptidoglycan/LPS O-acetylase OafA/YrhL
MYASPGEGVRTHPAPDVADAAGAAHAAAHSKLGYRPELDGLRGVAILAVFTHHLSHRLLPGGFLGVDLFFVLSGFLITYLLVGEWEQAGRISLRNFYARRALRLLPALFLWCAAFVAVAPLLGGRTAAGIYRGALLALTYFYNWVPALGYPLVSPLGIVWSLAIEEQFYLLWPPVLVVMLRRGARPRRLACGLALAVLSVCAHRAVLWQTGATVTRLYYGTDTRADALLVGCLLGVLAAYDLLPRGASFSLFSRAAAVAGAVALCWLAATVTWEPGWLYTGGLTLVACAAAAVILTTVVRPWRPAVVALRLPPLVWFGRISYGLYLWHFPVTRIIYPNQDRAPLAGKLLAGALSILCAAASYYVVERRFLRLKDRFSRRPPE